MPGARGAAAVWLGVALAGVGGVLPPAVAPDLAPGEIVERVVCAADPTKTYALYVPSTCDSSRRWPVLYALDPAARGRVPVETLPRGGGGPASIRPANYLGIVGGRDFN